MMRVRPTENILGAVWEIRRHRSVGPRQTIPTRAGIAEAISMKR